MTPDARRRAWLAETIRKYIEGFLEPPMGVNTGTIWRNSQTKAIAGHAGDLAALLDAPLRAMEETLAEIEGNLLYCPIAACAGCNAGYRCDCTPSCDVRTANHEQALSRLRAARTPPDAPGQG